MNIHWKDWCWSWNSNTLATCCKELTHLKSPWCWERLKAGGEGDDRGWDGWMSSPTQWTWVWVNSGNWWWTGKPGMLLSMGSQRVGHDWETELNHVYIHPLPLSFEVIFSHSEDCLFILLMVYFAVQKLLSLIRSYLFIFVFISITLGAGSKRIFLWICQRLYCLCFLLRAL